MSLHLLLPSRRLSNGTWPPSHALPEVAAGPGETAAVCARLQSKEFSTRTEETASEWQTHTEAGPSDRSGDTEAEQLQTICHHY